MDTNAEIDGGEIRDYGALVMFLNTEDTEVARSTRSFEKRITNCMNNELRSQGDADLRSTDCIGPIGHLATYRILGISRTLDFNSNES
mgnify:CR=1 FL=1